MDFDTFPELPAQLDFDIKNQPVHVFGGPAHDSVNKLNGRSFPDLRELRKITFPEPGLAQVVFVQLPNSGSLDHKGISEDDLRCILLGNGVPDALRWMPSEMRDPYSIDLNTNDSFKTIAVHTFGMEITTIEDLGGGAMRQKSIFPQRHRFPLSAYRPSPTDSCLTAVNECICIYELPDLLFITFWKTSSGTDRDILFFHCIKPLRDALSDIPTRTETRVSWLFPLATYSLLYAILHVEEEIIRRVEAALYSIDGGIAQNEIVRQDSKHWRQLIGRWRVHLHSRLEFFKTFATTIDRMVRAPAVDTDMDPEREDFEMHYLISRKAQDLETRCDFLSTLREGVLSHCESTFSALMATMSIIESEKAIEQSERAFGQAEQVTKLTQLAFFFIPLTFVAGIFGMNITDWGEGPRAWMWGVCSVALLATTYVVLYFGAVVQLARGIKKSLQRSSFRRPPSPAVNAALEQNKV